MSLSNNSILDRISKLLNAIVILSVLLGVFVLLNWNRTPNGIREILALRVTVKNVLVTAIFLGASMAIFRAFGLTAPSLSKPLWKELLKASEVSVIITIFALLFTITSTSGAFSHRIVLYYFPGALAALCGRLIATSCAEKVIRSLNGHRDLIIVGSGPRAESLYEQARKRGAGGFHVLGFVDSPNGHAVAAEIRRRMLGNLEDLEDILMRYSVDEVVITLSATSCYEQIQTAIHTCERVGVEAKVELREMFQASLARPKLDIQQGTPVVTVKLVQEDYRKFIKRCIDVVGAVVGLIAAGPLMLLIASVIRLTSPGPAVYVQQRYGFHKRTFGMYKFRTMVQNAEQVLATYLEQNPDLQREWSLNQKLREDPRITRIGKLLRKSSLDELPQLLNVLCGQMSLVGPRPIVDSELHRYGESFALYRQVPPGLTGLWQVSGRNDCSYQDRVYLDSYYVQNWSLWLDACLLARTLRILVTGQGAY